MAPRDHRRYPQELVYSVRVTRVKPGLGHLPILEVVDAHAVVVERSPLALTGRLLQRDRVLLVGQNVVKLDPESPARELGKLAEEFEDLLFAPVVAGKLVAPSNVPDDVVGEESPSVCMSPAENASYPRRSRSSFGWAIPSPRHEAICRAFW